MLTALAHRGGGSKPEPAAARRLKDEAARVLAEYKAKRATAEREADDIVTNARAEAERIAADAKAKMEDFVARRTKTAENKIALAEARGAQAARRRPRGGRRSRRDRRHHDPVAVGEGPGRRRPARKGHCRSPA